MDTFTSQVLKWWISVAVIKEWPFIPCSIPMMCLVWKRYVWSGCEKYLVPLYFSVCNSMGKFNHPRLSFNEYFANRHQICLFLLTNCLYQRLMYNKLYNIILCSLYSWMFHHQLCHPYTAVSVTMSLGCHCEQIN